MFWHRALRLNRLVIVCFAALALLLSSACTKLNDQSTSNSEEKPHILENDYEQPMTKNPPITVDSDSSKSTSQDKKGIVIASPDENQDQSKQNPNSSQYDFDTPYNLQKPTLMGLRIGDRVEIVNQKFGKPDHEYTMDDGIEPIVVYEYPGFSIGFDSSNRVIFVEVSTAQPNPGLNGLRIGDTASDAIQKLGKPYFASEFVLNYESGNTILKMDLDQATQTIHSIKLFNIE